MSKTSTPSLRCLALGVAALLFISSLGRAQAAPAQNPAAQWSQQVAQNPELLAAFGQLYKALQTEVRYPAPRRESGLLPLMPASTVFYAAVPNYGDAAHQALEIFHRELQQSPALRDWWTHGDMAVSGPNLELALENFYRLSQYLGDEMVISGGADGPSPNALLLAQIRKPGLAAALRTMLQQIPEKNRPQVRVLEPQDLASLPAAPGNQFLVLVRPDYLVGSPDPAALRSFSTRLDHPSSEFAGTAFGQRVTRAYQDGITMMAAADLQSLLKRAPGAKTDDLQRTGFADLQYLVWEHTQTAGRELSQSELSFTGPRRGIAAWLGAPRTLGSLDFASPKAMFALSLVLANPAQMFADVRDLATASNPTAFGGVQASEQVLGVDFQRDLLGALGGEITLELDSVTPPSPAWKAILQVTDPPRLQRTLATLLTAAHLASQSYQDSGITYHQVRIPSAATPTTISYAMVDGYLVVGSSPQAAAEAARTHRTGDSLGKSKRFLASVPPGHGSAASAVFYQDPAAMLAAQLPQMAPESARSLSQMWAGVPPSAMFAYGEPTAIRSTSTSAAMDAGFIMAGAAIAIPNVLRARTTADEATAVGTLRALQSAEQAYAAAYPDRGFAPDLATLGPDPASSSGRSAEHAGLVGNPPACSGGRGWCEHSGYRFRIAPVCLQQQCPQYVLMATPVASAGGRSFCSTSDGVIRFRTGPPLAAPVSLRECRSWPAVQ